MQAISDEMTMQRQRMTDHLSGHYRIRDERVLAAMNTVPRHRFVPEALRSQAYRDGALPIASGQTISQPFIVARMTELLELTGNEKVLEIGSGSGYQTAVLALLAKRVYSIERHAGLAAGAEQMLKSLGFRNYVVRAGDGTEGWKIYQPFDAILVTAGGPVVPQPLIDQLAVGGRLVIPVGEERSQQVLIRVTRTSRGFEREDFGPCAFVPLIGEHGW